MGWFDELLREFTSLRVFLPFIPLFVAFDALGILLCLILNLLIVWLVFGHSHLIMRILKEEGTKGMGKVFALFLAAFAVMMIRTGMMEWAGLLRQ